MQGNLLMDSKYRKDYSFGLYEILANENIYLLSLQIKQINIHQLLMLYQGFTVLSLCLLLVLACSRSYNVNVACGTCQSTTGCPGNKCISFSGQITAEYCNDKNVCSIDLKKNIDIYRCRTARVGQTCPSGVCVSGVNVKMDMKMCYNKICINGASFSETCRNRIVDTTEWGGLLGSTPLTGSYQLESECPYTSRSGQWSTCAGDAFGATCGCCVLQEITGMPAHLGRCIAASSPIVKVKSQLESGDKGFLSVMAIPILLLMMLAMGM